MTVSAARLLLIVEAAVAFGGEKLARFRRIETKREGLVRV